LPLFYYGIKLSELINAVSVRTAGLQDCMLATKKEQPLSETHHTTTTVAAGAAADARLSPSPVRHLTNRSGFRIRILQPPFSFIVYIIYLLPFPLLRTDTDLEPITN
jgi:hypothetical protein